MVSFWWIFVALFFGLWWGSTLALSGYFNNEVNDNEGV